MPGSTASKLQLLHYFMCYSTFNGTIVIFGWNRPTIKIKFVGLVWPN